MYANTHGISSKVTKKVAKIISASWKGRFPHALLGGAKW